MDKTIAARFVGNICKLTIIAALMGSLASCGTREDESATAAGAATGSSSGTDTSSIAGFWDFISRYVAISDTGQWSYATEDRNNNCYHVTNHRLTAMGGQRFNLDDVDGPQVIEATAENGSLTIVLSNGATSIYPEITSFTPQDINVCP